MRVKQANILEILKVWLKASAAERTALASDAAVSLATEAKADNKVGHSESYPQLLQYLHNFFSYDQLHMIPLITDYFTIYLLYSLLHPFIFLPL